MDYGTRLLEFRAYHNLTQKQLADILGITLNMIFRYENNRSQPTRRNKIKFESKLKEWEGSKSV